MHMHTLTHASNHTTHTHASTHTHTQKHTTHIKEEQFQHFLASIRTQIIILCTYSASNRWIVTVEQLTGRPLGPASPSSPWGPGLPAGPGGPVGPGGPG